MSWRLCYGRECKLGWGYNDPLRRLIPVEGDPPNVTSQAVSYWVYSVYPLSSTGIVCWYCISLLLEPSCKKELDFRIVFDDDQYWTVHCRFSRRREGSEKFSKYPSNCSHFIKHIDYGVDLRVYFAKTEFPEKDDEIKTLFEKRNFTETQKNTKCRVLINFNEIREMTLGELLEFMKELDEGKHSQYDIPVQFEYEKLTQEFRETVVSNQKQFGEYLSYLYSVYRKIEMKMEKAGYPDILPDLDSQGTSLVNICVNLNKAKEEYKSMDKNDLLKMYPVLKKLFFCYTDYIRYAIDHEDKIDEGDHLPGNSDEIEPWLRRLNNWFPSRINRQWVNCIEFFIGMPRGSDQVLQTLRGTRKFNNLQAINDDEATEPYIRKEDNQKILFGFVNMEGHRTDQSSEGSNLLELECPNECTIDLRKWICTKCGDYVTLKSNNVGWQFLFCSCGSKKYKDELLTCPHPSHRLQEPNKKQDEQEITHPPVPDAKETQNQTINHADPLSSICQQLRKIQIKNGKDTDPNIFIAIINLQSNNRSEEEIRNILQDLQNVTLDGDTQHLIKQYLEKNQKK